MQLIPFIGNSEPGIGEVLPRDAGLVLGLLGTPKAVARPITNILAGRRFADLTPDEGRRTLEGLTYLQWVRMGVAAAVWLIYSILTRDSRTTFTIGVGKALFGIATWFPAYMILISIAWLVLARTSKERLLGFSFPRLVKFVNWSPVLAGVAMLAVIIL